MESRPLIFYVNGKKVVENTPNPEWTLLYYLRHHLRLVGSKEGCGEGGCGACTVMQSRFDPETRKIHNMAINACLTPLCSVHGSAVITVEGIGSVRQGKDCQVAWDAMWACTPGFVMSMYALLRNNPKPTEHDMEEAFQGYRPILDGFRTLCCKDLFQGNGTAGKCCEAYDTNENVEEVADILFDESEFLPYDPTAEIIFPPELQVNF
ncbi:Xanthine dehydrogenase [Folsomia candida]|uniref:Xanthine dehydrogenase n=1 Tax=Folsomia candida TaxID=158441 RepID=A0A226DDA9_FOLCA|nr:Xanthine dehydrogenase [Folsomia candida]